MWIVIIVYLAALAASHVLSGTRQASPARSVRVANGDGATMAYSEWAAPVADAPVMVLLHGSPGESGNFARLAPMLTARGYRVIAPDLLGFGKSTLHVADHSIRAQGRAVGSLLEQLGVNKAHVVGWSNGGGAAMWLAHDEPDRVASLTLMGSIGEQRFEGSGNYYVEHVKYRVGFVLIGGVPELLPHFGALGSFDERVGWLRNFAQSDQREIAELLAELSRRGVGERTLVLHGAGDVLVRAQSAEAMHAKLAGSKLVMLDANHFLPFQQAEVTADVVDRFVRGEMTEQVMREPLARDRTGLLWLLDVFREGVRATPWWLHVLVIALVTLKRPAWGVLLASLAVASDFGPGVDIFVAFVGLFVGMALWTVRTMMASGHDASREIAWTRRLERAAMREGWNAGVLHSWRPEAAADMWHARVRRGRAMATYVVAVSVWCAVSLVVGLIGFVVIEHGFAARLHGWSAVVASVTLLLGMLKIGWSAPRVASLLSLRGWRFTRIAFERLVHFEYWPTWAVYMPILPCLFGLAFKHRKLLAFTAANPAISNAGGFVGEHKFDILRDLGASEFVARSVLVASEADGAVRLARARELLREVGAYPIIAKPNEGQRGHAVKLIRDDAALAAYLAMIPGDVVLQAFAEGPKECGVLWCRHAGKADGFIFSVTAKEFPVVEGDGECTLEQLIERHPRFRRQHRTFLTRFAAEATRVLARGEKSALGVAGNHCQGTKFVDGEHLITPELSAAVNGLCRAFARQRFANDPLGGLDWVRFDVRYVSDELLRQGRGFTIVEMNGTSAESTNMYDPARSLWWSYGVLWRQWQRLFALGRERMDAGGRALTARELLAMNAAHARQRRGSSVAD